MIAKESEGAKVLGAMSRLLKDRYLGVKVRRIMNKRKAVPSVLYGAETSGLNEREMRCLWSMCGVTIRIRNEEIMRRVGCKMICRVVQSNVC